MKSLAVSVLLAALAAVVISEPLHLDLDVQVELSDHGTVQWHEEPRAEALSVKITTDDGDELPEVDIDYEVHRASPPCTDCDYWSFTNIPYAEPPVDEYRFKAAQPWQRGRQSEVNNGSDFKICPQKQIGWAYPAFNFLTDYFNITKPLVGWTEPIEPEMYPRMGDPDPQAHESCLTLDVMVPHRAFKNKDKQKHPVVVWFFGGGYIFGSKTLFGNPGGLFNASSFMNDSPDDSNDDIIYVSVNYRLGAFGWLAGDSFEQDGGTENVGFSDQLRALEWVQEYIERFGGDPGRVTIMGQSAGASSVLHHITSNGGEGTPPFQQAIMQSPAFFPQADRAKMEMVYQAFLDAAGARDLAELRGKPTELLMEINANMTYRSPYGQFAFGPVVDGSYVPDLPGRLLMQGKFHQEIKVMAGYNRREGALFTPPWIRTRFGFRAHIQDLFPDFPKTDLDKVIQELYPINLWELDPRTKIGKVAYAMSDVAVDCNTYYLNKAFNNKTHIYKFNKYPGFHGQDANYTYWPVEAPPVNASIPLAQTMQRYFTHFIKTGDTNTGYDPPFNQYENGSQIMQFGRWADLLHPDKCEMIDDPMKTDHCEFWQPAPYYPEGATSKLFQQFRKTMQEL